MSEIERGFPISDRTQQADPPAAVMGSRTFRPPIYTLTGFAGLALAIITLRLWNADLRIPLYYAYGGDGLGQAALAKNLKEGGFSFWFPHLAAPLGAVLYDFPTLSALHITLERALIFLSGNAYIALNLLFVLAFPATAVTALYALRRLFVPTLFAVPLALAYSILPARFDRNEGHLYYSTYWLIPLTVALCVIVARGDLKLTSRGRPTRTLYVSLILGILIGADNQYHAFFAIAFLVLAGVLAYLRTRKMQAPILAGAVSCIIGFTVLGQLMPGFIYHRTNGPNPAAFERYPEESITYGLQIAQLILPIEGHRIHFIASKRQYYDERTGLGPNESSWSSFGFLGTLGFVALIGVVFVRSRLDISSDLETLALMNLWGVLIATVGGFGTLFNFFVAPEIRAYNRISTMLAFICLAGLGLVADSVLRRWNRKVPLGGAVALMAAIVLFAIWDQTAPGMVPPYASDAALFRSDEALTANVEASLAPGSALFELPWVRFPESPPVAQLDPENLFRPYLHARTLRFSYGAVDGRDPATWEQLVGQMSPKDIVRNTILGGYDGILIFRPGYIDGGLAIESGFRSLLGPPSVSPDGSLAFFSMRSLRERVVAAAPIVGTPAYQDAFVRVIGTTYEGSFSALESNATQSWRWSGNDSTIRLVNSSNERRVMRLRAKIEIASGANALTITFPERAATIAVNPDGTILDTTFTVPPGQQFVRFSTSAPPIVVPGDPRTLVFRLIDPILETVQRVPSRAESALADAALNAAPLERGAGPNASFVSGCSVQETSATSSWRWCTNAASVRIISNGSRKATIRFRASTPGQPTSLLSVSVGQRRFTVAIKPAGTDVTIPVDFAPERPLLLQMSSNAARLVAPGDPRTLVLRLDNFAILPG